jgi:hypothetical protein
MDKKALIDTLNNLTTGELSRLNSRLEELRAETERQGLDEVPRILGEARRLLHAGDIKGFRKKVQHAVSRLGHLR